MHQHETFWDKRSKHYDDDIKKHDSLYDKTIDSTKSLLTSSDVVLDLMHEHRIEKILVVDDAFKLTGLITVKDFQKAENKSLFFA